MAAAEADATAAVPTGRLLQPIARWSTEQILGWTEDIHCSSTAVAILKKKGLAGSQIELLDRPGMASMGISSLDQSRILGNLYAHRMALLAASAGNARERSRSSRRQTISYSIESMPETLRLLKFRVWELFKHDGVASRTKRLLVEGDLIKYQGRKGGQKRRYMLLDSCLLWCSVKSRGASIETDQLAVKGRLDRGVYSVIDVPDGTKYGRKLLDHAFKIFSKDKDKWYTLTAKDSDTKALWMNGFREAGIVVEQSSAFNPAKYDLPELTAEISNDDAMAIMIKVRDGVLTVNDAMALAKETATVAAKRSTEALDTPGDDDDDPTPSVLILGATDDIGIRVADKLLSAGARVRLGARDTTRLESIATAGADMVAFDLGDKDSWAPALIGCETIFLAGPTGATFAEDVAEFFLAAKSAGVKHVTKLSILGATGGDGPTSELRLVAQHSLADDALTRSGLLWTLIKPQLLFSHFLELQRHSITSGNGCLYGCSGSSSTAYLSPSDLADVVVITLMDFTRHADQTYELTGPAELTDTDVAELLSAHFGKPVGFVNVTPEHYEKTLAENGAQAECIADFVDAERLKAAGNCSAVGTGVAHVLGRPAVDLANFLATP